MPTPIQTLLNDTSPKTSITGVSKPVDNFNLGSVGTLALGGTNTRPTFSGGGLPAVSNPDATYSNLTRQEYDDYIRNFGGFELSLLDKSQNDTSLVDQAKVDAGASDVMSRGIAARNKSRYGIDLSPAQIAEQARSFDRAKSIAYDGGVNTSRVAQKTLNDSLLAGLVDLGNNINSQAQSGLATSAANYSQLEQQYRADRTAARAQTRSTVGALGAAAILALAF